MHTTGHCKINVAITTFNRLELTKRCIESLRHTDVPFQITVVDNASTDGTREYLSGLYRNGSIHRLCLLKRNMGVAVAANLGWDAVDSDYYVKLDNDIELKNPAWLRKLIDVLELNKDVGAAAYKFCDWHKTEEIALGSGTIFHKFNSLGGACVCIPRHIHNLLGYWNEDYGFYGFEDLDYGNRILNNGFLSGYCGAEEYAIHLGDNSYGSSKVEERKLRQVSCNASGRHLYLLNKFLFENNIRPQYVTKKYVPVVEDGQYTFRLCEKYKSTLMLLNKLNPSFKYNIDGEHVSIDMNILKDFMKT